MIISKEFYNRCPPSYKKAIDELEQTLANINVQEDNVSIIVQKQLAVLSFSKKYLTPKEYWEFCIRNINLSERGSPYYKKWKQCSSEIAKSLYFHLYYCNNRYSYIYYEAYKHKFRQLLDFCDKDELEYGGYEVYEGDLEYPHDFLEECFCYFERNATKLPSAKLIKRYEEMVELYQKITAAENGDTEKWFKLVLEVGDTDFVIANVEFRLGQNLLDAILWKLYIAFLKKAGQYKCLIETYSKYCRLFLDDNEMKEQYRQDTIKHGPVYLTWENLFEFEQKAEMDDEDESDYEDVEMKSKESLDKSLFTHFFDTYKVQNFSFRATLIRYILENANHRVLRKLFSTCKYFYDKKSTPICYSLKTCTEECFDEENLVLKYSSDPELFLKRTHITGEICAEENDDVDTDDIDPFFLSDIIPRLYRCEAKFIYLCNQNLSFNELKFLIKHGGVVDLVLNLCEIEDDNNDKLLLEDIMAFLPNIEKLWYKTFFLSLVEKFKKKAMAPFLNAKGFGKMYTFLPSVLNRLSDIKTSANTGHALSNQKFFGMIYYFKLYWILGEPFDADDFLKFLIVNRDENRLNCCFSFCDDFDVAFTEKFEEIMECYEYSEVYEEGSSTSIIVE